MRKVSAICGGMGVRTTSRGGGKQLDYWYLKNDYILRYRPFGHSDMHLDIRLESIPAPPQIYVEWYFSSSLPSDWPARFLSL